MGLRVWISRGRQAGMRARFESPSEQVATAREVTVRLRSTFRTGRLAVGLYTLLHVPSRTIRPCVLMNRTTSSLFAKSSRGCPTF